MVSRQGDFPLGNPGQFSDALSYTASRTGFSSRLIEKDCYCSLILREFAPLFAAGLVFKGGTSLSKVHAGFHRLSEDLDFTIPIETNASRARRRAAVEPTKEHLQQLTAGLAWLTVLEPLGGSNINAHYKGLYSYRSHLTGEQETIKIEISLREPLLEPAENTSAETILLDPHSTERALQPVSVVAMSLRESYAEKIRAALSRRDPAIRDFFDIDHAIENRILDIAEGALLELVRRKISVSPKEPSDVSSERLHALRQQVEPQLRPVLRADDFSRFDLGRAFETIRRIESQLR